MEITQELVKEYFDYKDGFLYWKKLISVKCSRAKVGQRAAFLNNERYKVKFNFKLYLCSRLIFLWHNGYLPEIVDHINHDTKNDNIENLRAATRYDNCRNVTSHINSTSKYLGVSLNKSKNSIAWNVHVSINGKDTHIGRYQDEKEAALAYNEAASKHYGQFANLNKI